MIFVELVAVYRHFSYCQSIMWKRGFQWYIIAFLFFNFFTAPIICVWRLAENIHQSFWNFISLFDALWEEENIWNFSCTCEICFWNTCIDLVIWKKIFAFSFPPWFFIEYIRRMKIIPCTVSQDDSFLTFLISWKTHSQGERAPLVNRRANFTFVQRRMTQAACFLQEFLSH